MRTRHLPALLAGLGLSVSVFAASSDKWDLPVHTKKLDNDLTVIVSEDHSSPTVGVSVVYHGGMRLELKNRTGFAHLFEQLMFQGTPNAPKGSFDKTITGGGGHNNGSTRPDFTNYIETAPASSLESIRDYAKRFRPDRALLVITGRIKEAEAMKLAQAACGD